MNAHTTSTLARLESFRYIPSNSPKVSTELTSTALSHPPMLRDLRRVPTSVNSSEHHTNKRMKTDYRSAQASSSTEALAQTPRFAKDFIREHPKCIATFCTGCSKEFVRSSTREKKCCKNCKTLYDRYSKRKSRSGQQMATAPHNRITRPPCPYTTSDSKGVPDFANHMKMSNNEIYCNYHERDYLGHVTDICYTHAVEDHIHGDMRVLLCEQHYEEYTKLKFRISVTDRRKVFKSTWDAQVRMLDQFGQHNEDRTRFLLEEAKKPLTPMVYERGYPSQPPPALIRTMPPKKLSSTIRTKCWELYASKFIRHFIDDKWFQLNNPRDQPFCVIRCWCCGEQALTHNGYTNRFHERSPTFECGHVYAQSRTGNDGITNLRPICSDCNRKQGTMSMYEFARKCSYHLNRYSLISIEQQL